MELKKEKKIIQGIIKIHWVVDVSLLVECEGLANHISQTRQTLGPETLGTS